MSRGLRFAAMAVVVVLALTGFSTGRGGRGSSGGDGGGSGGSGGGGCSNSSQDHDSSSSSSGGYRDYDHDDDYSSGSSGSSGSSSSSGSERLRDGTVKLISCATEDAPYATVEITNPNSRGTYFTVTVDFFDAASRRVERRTEDEFVAAREKLKVQVDLSSPGVEEQVDHCEARPTASAG